MTDRLLSIPGSARLWLAHRLDLVARLLRHGAEERPGLEKFTDRRQFHAEVQKLALEKRIEIRKRDLAATGSRRAKARESSRKLARIR
jgi:hypothetical protein